MGSVAIVGAGVSGLVAARRLAARHDVVLYEARERAGGHACTVEVEAGGRRHAVDTGFVVFNERAYPQFCALLAELGVEHQPAPMTFSVRCERTGVEWGGSGLAGVFAQRRNLLRPRLWRMLADIVRFGREAGELLTGDAIDEGLEAYLRRRGYSDAFRELYLVPMAAAIWSAGTEEIAELPARVFARFFDNHGMLDIRDAPQWLAVRGGSASYVDAIAADLGPRLRLSAPVERVIRSGGGVEVRTRGGGARRFDAAVLATHSDQALRALEDPSPAEREILGAIRYGANDVVLHTDPRLMPCQRRAWAAWNYHATRERTDRPTVTYDMSALQSLDGDVPILVTLNRGDAIREDAVLRRMTYAHPRLTREALAAQRRVGEISGLRGVHYAGAYWGYGFHEDGVESALRVEREVERALARPLGAGAGGG